MSEYSYVDDGTDWKISFDDSDVPSIPRNMKYVVIFSDHTTPIEAEVIMAGEYNARRRIMNLPVPWNPGPGWSGPNIHYARLAFADWCKKIGY